MERLDAYTSLRKRRADKVYVVSNGKNTIYALDYVVKAQRVYHDPVVYIVGPDAPEIAKKTLNNLTHLLLPKTYTLRLNERAIADFSRLRGCNKLTLTKKIEEIFEEAELALKMVLLDGKKRAWRTHRQGRSCQEKFWRTSEDRDRHFYLNHSIPET